MDWKLIAARVLSYEFGLTLKADDVDRILAGTTPGPLGDADLRARAEDLARFLEVLDPDGKAEVEAKPKPKQARRKK